MPPGRRAGSRGDTAVSGLRPLDPADPPAVGPFALLARLGAGAMGTVFLARSAGGRPVAVKLVHPGLAADQDFRARFRREVAAALEPQAAGAGSVRA